MTTAQQGTAQQGNAPAQPATPPVTPTPGQDQTEPKRGSSTRSRVQQLPVLPAIFTGVLVYFAIVLALFESLPPLIAAAIAFGLLALIILVWLMLRAKGRAAARRPGGQARRGGLGRFNPFGRGGAGGRAGGGLGRFNPFGRGAGGGSGIRPGGGGRTGGGGLLNRMNPFKKAAGSGRGPAAGSAGGPSGSGSGPSKGGVLGRLAGLNPFRRKPGAGSTGRGSRKPDGGSGGRSGGSSGDGRGSDGGSGSGGGGRWKLFKPSSWNFPKFQKKPKSAPVGGGDGGGDGRQSAPKPADGTRRPSPGPSPRPTDRGNPNSRTPNTSSRPSNGGGPGGGAGGTGGGNPVADGNDLNPGVIDEEAGVIRWVKSTETIAPALRAAAAELTQMATEAGEQHPIDAAFAQAMKIEADRMRAMAELAEKIPETAEAQARAYFDSYFNPRYGSIQREARADAGPAADGQ